MRFWHLIRFFINSINASFGRTLDPIHAALITSPHIKTTRIRPLYEVEHSRLYDIRGVVVVQ